VATISLRSSTPTFRKIRSLAKRKTVSNGPSFGAAVKKYAGILRSGSGVSTREGFGD
jgi:hypothetical protein